MDQYKKPEQIGVISFLDVEVPIYYDSTAKDSYLSCSWQARNPNSFYVGIVYMNNETGKITYPADAIIPEQTERDREILPKFIITGFKEINSNITDSINYYLESDYKRRNKIKK